MHKNVQIDNYYKYFYTVLCHKDYKPFSILNGKCSCKR
jgi:hypothetical protein